MTRHSTTRSYNYRSLGSREHVPRNVTWADLSPWTPSFACAKGKRGSAAQAHGNRYEKKVQRYLTKHYPGTYIPSLWFRYSVHGHPHWNYCQPDGLLFDFNRNLITVVEIKLGHSLRAWKQIRTLYEPVVKRVFGPYWRYAACEVASYHDPAIVFPEPLHYITRLSFSRPGQFGLCLIKERKLNASA